MSTESVTKLVIKKVSVAVKGMIIVAVVLLLLIPAEYIKELIREREQRQKEAFGEVSARWAGRQDIIGPVLVLPYNAGTGGTMLKKFAYILPDKLSIDAVVKPETRHRGIFQIMLYSSVLNIQGKFAPLPLAKLNLDPASIIWDEAYVCMRLSDPRGLKDELRLKWNDSSYLLSPAMVNNGVMQEGLITPVKLDPSAEISFSSAFTVLGSEQLLFTPIGKETKVKMSSTWPDPSFTGGQLPDHQITDSGFVASWSSLAHTRKFPQVWTDNVYILQSASFGADLYIAVNGYQKTMRSVKYAILCILLTFVAFFIIETVSQRSIHPLHYALIGLALLLFYTLLLSFSEYTGFNVAYIISAVATIGLITWFVKGVLKTNRFAVLMGVVLLLIYSYIFTILQLQDYSLLVGSIGLFLTLGVVMYFSKKINW